MPQLRLGSSFPLSAPRFLDRLQLFNTAVFGGVAYFMVGLQAEPGKFLVFMATLAMLTFVAEAYVVAVGTLAPTPKVAQILCPVFLTLFLLFGGFFTELRSIPPALSWFQYLSFFKFTFSAFVQNELAGLGNDLAPAALAKYGGGLTVGGNLAVLAGMAVFYRALGCFFLAWRAPRVAFPQAGDEAAAAPGAGTNADDNFVETPVKHVKKKATNNAKEMVDPTTPLLLDPPRGIV